MYSWLTPRVSLPVFETLTGRRIWSRVEELDRLQWQSPEQLAEKAGRKLGELVDHAARNVPYYRRLFSASGIEPREISSVADLARLPVSVKRELRSHYPDGLLAGNLPAKRRQAGSTSGSSGAPFAFFLDRQMVDRWIASYLFFLGWAGAALWHTGIIIAGPRSAPWLRNRSRLEKISRRLLLGEHPIVLEGKTLSAPRLGEIVSTLPRRRPYFLWAYASYAERFADQILKDKLDLSRAPGVVICVAETLSAVGEERVRQAFGCPVVRHYSCLEIPRIAQACPDNPATYHVNSERCWVRLVDDLGRDVEVGERGRVIVTDLDNHVMPFINYDLGDVARKVDPCPCGRGLPTLGPIEGRQAEIVVTPDGSAISPAAVGMFLTRVCRVTPLVSEYQLLVEDETSFTLRLVPTARSARRLRAAVEPKLSEFFGPEAKVEIEMVDEIASEPSGKRLIIKRADPRNTP